MSIRLNKVVKNLNVGLSTIVDFLNKKGYSIEANPNTKISEEQHDLLIKEFSKDKNLKLESNKKSQEWLQKDKKETVAVDGYNHAAKKEEIKTEVPDDKKPKFNIVGSIDLDSSNKKKPQPEPQPPVPEPVPDPVTPEVDPVKADNEDIKPEVPQPDPDVVTPPVEKENKEEEKPGPVDKEVDDTPVAQPDTPVAQPDTPDAQPDTPDAGDIQPEGEPEAGEGEGVFRLQSPRIESGIKVTGKIDLSSINQSTRPKKKTKEEKKQERLKKEEEAAKANALRKQELDAKKAEKKDKPGATPSTDKKRDDNSDPKKKRKRIVHEKVDIKKDIAKNTQGRSDRARPVLRKPAQRNEISEEDVQKQIKETLAYLTNKGQKKGAKYRKEKREAVVQKQSEQYAQDAQAGKVIQITEFVTANDLANMMNVPVVQIISTCMTIGIMVSINQRLDAETINIVADEFGYKTEYVSAEVVEAITEEVDREEDLQPRPPIVTVMGHVDHGKTSLLDSIRDTNVIAGEAGGITQHIGAYNVELPDGRKITFLDTPGHEAFTAMRARGASVTDIAIIIVAADDNVMPQTREAINHAAAAGVPMVFAINKIDKPGANPEKIKETLAGMNYLVEEWGGDYQSQDISAKKGIGISELLDKVLLQAELLDLKANPNRRAVGSVIESSLDKGRGYVVTMLVQNGTLKMGDVVLAGTHFGRIKAMFNERNQRINEAGPSEPVLILGLNGAPTAGDVIHVLETEQEAREIATKREQLQREQGLRTQKLLTLDDIGRRIAIGNFQQLNIIVKGDVDGSVEAISDSLIRLSTEQIQVNVIHKGVGQISESDVILAAASDAIIVGFQVRPSQTARKLAEKEGVDIRLYSIIYDAIEEVKAAMEGLLSPDIKEEIVANVEVREIFKISKVGTVAGCQVRDGKIKRNNKIRLVRDGIVIYTGDLGSLKRFKEDVREVAQGYECGLNINNFNDIKVGDIVEAFEEVEVKQTL